MAHEHARPYLQGELTRQIDQVLGQLRMAQVSTESHASQQGGLEDNDLDRACLAADWRRPERHTPSTLRRCLMNCVQEAVLILSSA